MNLARGDRARQNYHSGSIATVQTHLTADSLPADRRAEVVAWCVRLHRETWPWSALDETQIWLTVLVLLGCGLWSMPSVSSV